MSSEFSSLTLNNLGVLPLKPYSDQLSQGDLVFLAGKSGSGKTQFLRAIADLAVSTGSVSLNNKDRTAWTPARWRSQVIMVPNVAVWWSSSMFDHFPVDTSKQWLVEQFDRLDLSQTLMLKNPQTLSTGQAQRLALIRAVARKPKVLLLDELTANLDEQASALTENYVLQFVKTGAAVWVSHNEQQISQLAKRHGQTRLWRIVAGNIEQVEIENCDPHDDDSKEGSQ